MRLSYVGGSEQDGAKFWLKRIGWEPSEVAREIVEENNPEKTSYIADIGGLMAVRLHGLLNKGFGQFWSNQISAL